MFVGPDKKRLFRKFWMRTGTTVSSITVQFYSEIFKHSNSVLLKNMCSRGSQTIRNILGWSLNKVKASWAEQQASSCWTGKISKPAWYIQFYPACLRKCHWVPHQYRFHHLSPTLEFELESLNSCIQADTFLNTSLKPATPLERYQCDGVECSCVIRCVEEWV